MNARISRLTYGIVTLAILALTPLSTPAFADTIRDQQWFLGFLDIDRAQQISQGQGVVIAVVDSGVDGTHQDLAGNVLPGAKVVGDQQGDAWTDANGHGTNIAGIIAAHRHGDSGALGIAPVSKILPLQDETSTDAGTPDDQARAINIAVDRGAKVICVAQGGSGSDALRLAVERARHADLVIVAAAGNKPEAAIVDWPAHYDGVVAVGAVDRNGNHAPISVTGPQVLLSAPGVDIVSTNRGGGYSKGTGTSAATAIVAGVAALVRAKYPTMSATEVIHRLIATATDKGPPGRDPEYGYGIVNPVAALTADVPPLQASSSSAAGTGTRSTRSTPAAAPSGRSSTPLIAAVLVVGLLLGGLAGLAAIRRRATARRHSGRGAGRS